MAREPQGRPTAAQAGRDRVAGASARRAGATAGGRRPLGVGVLASRSRPRTSVVQRPCSGSRCSASSYEVDGYPRRSSRRSSRTTGLPTWALAGHPDPVDPDRLPGDLLLLPARPTTGRTSPIRPACAVGEPHDPSALPAGDRVPVHPPEPPSLLPVPRVRPARRSSGSRSGFVHRRRRRRGSASAASSCSSTRPCSPATRPSCHSLRHLVGGRLDCFSCSRANRTRHSALAAAQRPEPPAHGLGLGEPHLGRRRRPVRPPARARDHRRSGDPVLGASTMARSDPRDPPIRRARHRRGRRRPAGGDRATGRRRERRARLQVAPRQGPHGHGRGRRRGRAGQRRVRRFLAGPLPRHDGRRQAPEPARGWPSSTPRRRRPASTSSSTGARCSIGRGTGGSSSDRSAGTPTRASPTSATGPGSR